MESRIAEAIELMDRFSNRTGVEPPSSDGRYLWTDAFAVMNDVALFELTAEDRFRRRARQLVDRVHASLGRHRRDEARTGPLGERSEAEARRHPTRGGLRIGKPFPERPPGQRLDPRGEWDRDGQYFHYLTRWMQALDRASRALGEPELNRWALELAETAHGAFVRPTGGEPPMAWKMSIDLTRPQVPSMGLHDPLDGFVTCRQIEATRRDFGLDDAHSVRQPSADFANLIDPDALTTTDPLGIGTLAMSAAQLEATREPEDFGARRLLESLLVAVSDGIDGFLRQGTLREPAGARLAFRELGLAIGLFGLQAVEDGLRVRRTDPRDQNLWDLVQTLTPFVDLGRELVSFWRKPERRATELWRSHRDINDVMLATGCVPRGAVRFPPVSRAAS